MSFVWDSLHSLAQRKHEILKPHFLFQIFTLSYKKVLKVSLVFSMFQTLSMIFWKIKAKITESQLFSKILFYYINFWKHLKKSWDSVVSALIFQKNIEKVWEIEKIWNIAKFRKNQGKNDRVQVFFYSKVFRWTGLGIWGICK